MLMLNMMEFVISCYVYVLRLDKNSFYTGLTNNIERRIKEHRSKKTGYTSKFNEKEIVFLFKLDNRKEARKVEIYIKAVGARNFLLKYEKSLRADKRTELYNKSKLLTI